MPTGPIPPPVPGLLDEFVSLNDCAAQLGTSPRTLQRWNARGRRAARSLCRQGSLVSPRTDKKVDLGAGTRPRADELRKATVPETAIRRASVMSFRRIIINHGDLIMTTKRWNVEFSFHNGRKNIIKCIEELGTI
jgi:hypothetical protein